MPKLDKIYKKRKQQTNILYDYKKILQNISKLNSATNKKQLFPMTKYQVGLIPENQL
jgi:hypothetical protein